NPTSSASTCPCLHQSSRVMPLVHRVCRIWYRSGYRATLDVCVRVREAPGGRGLIRAVSSPDVRDVLRTRQDVRASTPEPLDVRLQPLDDLCEHWVSRGWPEVCVPDPRPVLLDRERVMFQY